MSVGLQKIRASLPNALVDKIERDFGLNLASRVLQGFAAERAVSLRVNTLKSTSQHLMEFFRGKGIKFGRISQIENAFTISNANESLLEKLEVYKEGGIYLQNLASQLPVRFLDPKPGEKVLDMCSAPGSKTTQIAAMMQNSGQILANEIDRVRLEKLKHNLSLQGVKIAELLLGNGTRLGDEHTAKFDKVLLDAPCSAEGRIRLREKRSYGFWSEKVVRENAKLQKKLIISGLKALRPGGIMIYSTCSLMKEENDEVVEFAVEQLGASIKAEKVKLELNNTLPGKYGVTVIPDSIWEGFYVSKIVRKI